MGKPIKIMLDKSAKMPTRAHDTDAGFDLYTPVGGTIPAFGNRVFDTGVHIEIPKGYVGFLKSKSGLNVKHDLTSEGVIDSGYTGSIVVKLYNHGDFSYQVKEGDKIPQIVILPIWSGDLVQVDHFEDTDRGKNGFGSTGR